MKKVVELNQDAVVKTTGNENQSLEKGTIGRAQHSEFTPGHSIVEFSNHKLDTSIIPDSLLTIREDAIGNQLL